MRVKTSPSAVLQPSLRMHTFSRSPFCRDGGAVAASVYRAAQTCRTPLPLCGCEHKERDVEASPFITLTPVTVPLPNGASSISNDRIHYGCMQPSAALHALDLFWLFADKVSKLNRATRLSAHTSGGILKVKVLKVYLLNML